MPTPRPASPKHKVLVLLWGGGSAHQVMANIGGEDFTATGLMVTERNWLVVYEPFERWTGRTIPEFFQGQEFVPSVLVVSFSRVVLLEGKLLAKRLEEDHHHGGKACSW